MPANNAPAATHSLTPSALGEAASFGFGDRLGLATPGHLAALREAGAGAGGFPIRGIFAQQSIREMARTQRTPEQVMAAAVNALTAAGFNPEEPWGADADHLKTPADVDITADAGFVFFTIDPSDHVDQQADSYDPATVELKFEALPPRHREWIEPYRDSTVRIPQGPAITLDAATLKRAAVKYGPALAQALELASYIRSAAEQRGQPHEIEISVDETEQPTTAAEHYLMADQLLAGGVKLVSLAPRFIGELEKGVDYIGDVTELERTLNEHAAIARHLGEKHARPYKLSLHSGSDKLSMYPAFARATRGHFHVKTAGTSYLEALRVVARHGEADFRRIIAFSREHYDTDKATYHVHATLNDVPSPEDLPDARALESAYLEQWTDVPAGKGFTEAGRQILHCTFGSVVTDPSLGPLLRDYLTQHADTYTQVLQDHFARHLQALQPA